MRNKLTWSGIRLLQVAAIVAFVHLASACSHVSEMPGPNGERLVATKCNGIALDYSDCLRRIAETCPNGYNISGIDRKHCVCLVGHGERQSVRRNRIDGNIACDSASGSCNVSRIVYHEESGSMTNLRDAALKNIECTINRAECSMSDFDKVWMLACVAFVIAVIALSLAVARLIW